VPDVNMISATSVGVIDLAIARTELSSVAEVEATALAQSVQVASPGPTLNHALIGGRSCPLSRRV
jgi:hypothetical protein